jgi:hypothetical protein
MLCLEINMTIGDEPNDKISKLRHSLKKNGGVVLKKLGGARG